MTRKRVGVLISGRGSNLQALIDAQAAPDYPAEIVLVLSNIPGAQGLTRAEAAGIPAITSTANADNVTLDHPWYFQMTFNNTTQGALLAAYLHDVLNADQISLIVDNSDYGRSLLAGLMSAYPGHGQIRHALSVGKVSHAGLPRGVAPGRRRRGTVRECLRRRAGVLSIVVPHR